MMKCCSTVYVLTILFVGLASTAPTKKDFLRSLYNGKSFKAGDIWSDCSKYLCIQLTLVTCIQLKCTQRLACIIIYCVSLSLIAKPGDHGKVNSIDITPLPPVRGSDVTIHANLTTGKFQ